MPCIPGTGTCVGLGMMVVYGLGYGITALGIAASVYDATAEYKRWTVGESVFNGKDAREKYIQREMQELCARKPESSADCAAINAAAKEANAAASSSSSNTPDILKQLLEWEYTGLILVFLLFMIVF